MMSVKTCHGVEPGAEEETTELKEAISMVDDLTRDINISCDEEKKKNISIIDNIPSIKERNKVISQCSVNLFMYLHAMDQDQFHKYSRTILSRQSHKCEYSFLVGVAEADRCANTGDAVMGLQILDHIESLIGKSDFPLELSVRYLTSKSMLNKMLSRNNECSNMQKQAIQVASQMSASNATAFSYTIYALHSLLHDRGFIKTIGSNSCEGTWRQAEFYCIRACEQHQEWVKDLEEDYHIPDSVIKSFFLFAFIRYTAVLLRSCLGGGFEYFDKHHIPMENLTKALSCIERIKSQSHLLSTRNMFEFCLVQCDYHLRLYNMYKDKTNMSIIDLEKAKSFAERAMEVVHSYKEQKTARFHGSFPKIRLDYIYLKLNLTLEVMDNKNSDIVFNYNEFIEASSGQQTTGASQQEAGSMTSFQRFASDGRTFPKQPVSILSDLNLVSIDTRSTSHRTSEPEVEPEVASLNMSETLDLPEPDSRSTYVKEATGDPQNSDGVPLLDLRLDDELQTLRKSYI